MTSAIQTAKAARVVLLGDAVISAFDLTDFDRYVAEHPSVWIVP